MTITKDYEGNKVVEDKQLATKPDGNQKTLDELISFTSKLKDYIDRAEEEAGGIYNMDQLLDVHRDLKKELDAGLTEYVSGTVNQDVMDLYFSKMMQADDDTQCTVSFFISALVQRAYNDGTYHIVLDSDKHSCINGEGFLIDLRGTLEEPLHITCRGELDSPPLAATYCTIRMVGPTPGVLYYDDTNCYVGEHDNMDALKQCAKTTTKKHTQLLVDESGKNILEEGF